MHKGEETKQTTHDSLVLCLTPSLFIHCCLTCVLEGKEELFALPSLPDFDSVCAAIIAAQHQLPTSSETTLQRGLSQEAPSQRPPALLHPRLAVLAVQKSVLSIGAELCALQNVFSSSDPPSVGAPFAQWKLGHYFQCNTCFSVLPAHLSLVSMLFLQIILTLFIKKCPNHLPLLPGTALLYLSATSIL